MAKWNYTIRGGKFLREAIDEGNINRVVSCLLQCYRELFNVLSEEDKDWKGFDIEDAIEIIASEALEFYHDEDEVDDYLEVFYDLCDELGAWVAI